MIGNAFVIFGYMVWIIATFAAWIVGLAATLAGIGDRDGEMTLGGVVILLLGMLSTSFLLAGIQ